MRASSVIALVVVAMGTACVRADTLDLGAAAGYAVVDLGSGKTIGQNSGPINGSELLGNGVTAAFSGGGHGAISGTVYYDNTVGGTNTFSQFQPTPPTTSLVSTSVTNQALSGANAVAATAASLTPTQTFTGTISSPTTFHGNGGLNVIDVNNIQNAPLTIQGNSNDRFVINVAGTFNTNVAMTLSGVTASQILFNFTGTSGNVFSTSGGDTVYGTFLAADGGDFQFSNLNLVSGELIDTKGGMQIVSGSQILGSSTFAPLPLPSPLWAASALFALLGLSKFLGRRTTI